MNPLSHQSNKKVLVTGSEGALGRKVVERYLKAGCQVTGTQYLSSTSGGSGNSGGSGSGSLHTLEIDLNDSQDVKRKLGEESFDAVIHCAGGFRFSPVDLVQDGDLDFLLNANLRSSILLLREVLPPMKRQGYGRIVLISSKATLHPGAGVGIYAASKAGINMLVESTAEEVKAWDITVNAILPSVIDTEANRKSMPNADFSKWVSPEDLAEIIFSLTSPWGKSIHGALIPVSGRV